MKILIIGNGAVGKINGKYYVNKHTSNFCNELVESGLDVGFLQFDKTMKNREGLQDVPINSSIKVHSVSMDLIKNKTDKIFLYFKMILFILKIVKKYDFIYIFYPGYVPFISITLCKMFNIDYALYVRGAYEDNSKIQSYFIKKAKFCLTVSELLKQQLLRYNKNVEIIAPMIDFSLNDIIYERNYNESKNKKCLFVGRVEKRKGIFVLAEAIKKLSKKNIDISFDIIGAGEDLSELKEVLSQYKNVTLHGQVSDKNILFSFYSQSDMFVFPTYYPEGFPRVIYEAMIARTPIITTNSGGIGSMMKNKYNCLLVKQKDVNSLYEAIVELNESNTIREQIVTQASEDIFSILNGERKKHSKLVIDKIRE